MLLGRLIPLTVAVAAETHASQAPAWLEGFRRDGFVPKLGVLPQETAQLLRDVTTRMFKEGVDFSEQVINAHIVAHPELMRVARDPAILDALAAVVGPDVMLVSTTFFAKMPVSEEFTADRSGAACGTAMPTVVGAHQDRQYWGIEPQSAEVVSVWVAVDDTDKGNGCIQFFPGTQHSKLQHVTNADNCSALKKGQGIPAHLLPDDPVDAELRSGEYAIFGAMTAHRSGRNRSRRRRIGYTMVFAAAHASYTAFEYEGEDWRIPSVLVRGSAENTTVQLANPDSSSPSCQKHPIVL